MLRIIISTLMYYLKKSKISKVRPEFLKYRVERISIKKLNKLWNRKITWSLKRI